MAEKLELNLVDKMEYMKDYLLVGMKAHSKVAKVAAKREQAMVYM
jgi:hypothetical protein